MRRERLQNPRRGQAEQGGENELQASLSLYEFQVTGRASALVRFNSWDHASNRLMTVFDIGRDQFSITQE